MAGTQTELHGRRAGLDNDSNRLALLGRPFSVTMTVATDGSNKSKVTCQLVDVEGTSISKVMNFDLWLSDATTGAGLTATTASGAVAAGASGADIATLTSKKALRVQTNASGRSRIRQKRRLRSARRCRTAKSSSALRLLRRATANSLCRLLMKCWQVYRACQKPSGSKSLTPPLALLLP
jgi:hypothetical protein